MRNRVSMKGAANQRGAVLIVSLLLLLVMTLLGLGASQSTRLQERMAGNQRDLELAMQGAEASLRATDDFLSTELTLATCIAPAQGCEAYEMRTLTANGVALDLARQSDAWWATWGYTYAQQLESVSTSPEAISERIAESRDTLSQGGSYMTVVRDFHRTTARSRGMTDTAQVVVQSTHARVSFE